jgi:putative PIN family toxin of toxin-antitoxin system
VLDIATSKVLLDELSRVLRDRFEYSGEKVAEIRQRLERLCTLVEPAERITGCSDPDDDRVLECAVAAKAGFIVTGDNALLRLNPFRNIQILTAAQLLDREPWLAPAREE